MEEDGGSTLLRRMLHKAARAAIAIARLRLSPTTTTPYGLPPSLLDCADDEDHAASFHTASSTPAVTVQSRLGSPGAAVEASVGNRAAEFIEPFRRSASLELRYCLLATPTSPETNFNLSSLGSPGVDSLAAQFIESFHRDAALELRYCSPVTPARPPMSPDTYFNLSSLGSPGVDSLAAQFIESFHRDAALELRYCSPVTPARPPMSPDTYFNLSRLHGAEHDHGLPVHARPAYGRVSPKPGGMSIRWPSGPYRRGRPSVQV